MVKIQGIEAQLLLLYALVAAVVAQDAVSSVHTRWLLSRLVSFRPLRVRPDILDMNGM